MRHLLVLLAMACLCASSRADRPYSNADVICSRTGNAALVRFRLNDMEGGPALYAKLPSAADGGLSRSKGENRTDCRMRNGWAVRVRTGSKQAFPYGQGGGNPPGFFSLWIGQHKILSRYEWKPGYENSFGGHPTLVGLVIRPGSLTYCTQDEIDEDGPITCKEKPFDIGKHKIDVSEYPATPGKKMSPGSAYVVDARAGRQFCEDELVSAQSFMEADISAWVPDGFKPFNSKEFDGELALLGLNASLPRVAGKRVVSLSSNGHYFNGDVIIIAPTKTPTAAIGQRFPGDDVEKEVAQTLPPGWTVIAGGQKAFYPDVAPRYVHFNALDIDGSLYFFARPSNIEEHPGATLVKPLAAGGYQISCTFDVVQPNY